VEKAREPALAETLNVEETGDKDVVRMTYQVKVNFVGEGNKRTCTDLSSSAGCSVKACPLAICQDVLQRQGVPARDLEDLSQDVLLSVVKHLSSFKHTGHRGAFRSWLRTIVCGRTTD
jgi:hypothetical protein